MSVKFTMAVGAKHYAFIRFILNPLPASRISFTGNAKVLLKWIAMVKLQSFHAAIVSALLALASLIFNRHHANFFSSRMNSVYKVLPAIAIFTLFFPHRIALHPLHSLATLTRAQPHALPAELQGNKLSKNNTTKTAARTSCLLRFLNIFHEATLLF